MNSYSTASSTSSTTTLVSTSQNANTKDFQAAFGALSSSYGFGGSAPAVTPKKSTNLPNVHQTPQSMSMTSSSTKDYAAAFGSMSSSYGFTGGVPSLPRKL